MGTPGYSFGEIALINDNERTASVITREDSVFLSLDRQTYFKIFGKFHSEKINNEFQFLKSYHFFKRIPDRYILNLVYELEYHSFQRNSYIYKADEKVENLYFIKSGIVEI